MMTTGMSAPPMEWTMCSPSPAESTVVSPRQVRPTAGEGPLARMAMEMSMVAAIDALSASRTGSLSAAEERLPLSLAKAMSEPVVVTPPIAVASPIETSRTASSPPAPVAMQFE